MPGLAGAEGGGDYARRDVAVSGDEGLAGLRNVALPASGHLTEPEFVVVEVEGDFV
jgi:hypothetical protein